MTGFRRGHDHQGRVRAEHPHRDAVPGRGRFAVRESQYTALKKALPAAYKVDQDPAIVPEKAYGAATNTYSRIEDNQLSFFNQAMPLSGISVDTGGSGYTSAPAVAITGGGGSFRSRGDGGRHRRRRRRRTALRQDPGVGTRRHLR